MSTQLHDGTEYLTESENLLPAISALVSHAWAVTWPVLVMEKNAKAIYSVSCPEYNEYAHRLDRLTDKLLIDAESMKQKGWGFFIVHRSLLNSATLFARSACLVRGEDPASVPTLDPLWRSAAGALSDIFRVV
jgi:hypothetical protein